MVKLRLKLAISSAAYQIMLAYLPIQSATHWGRENSLHWVLDVVFREDDSRIRVDNAPQNFAILRHIANSLLQQDKSVKTGIKNKRLKAGWDNE